MGNQQETSSPKQFSFDKSIIALNLDENALIRLLTLENLKDMVGSETLPIGEAVSFRKIDELASDAKSKLKAQEETFVNSIERIMKQLDAIFIKWQKERQKIKEAIQAKIKKSLLYSGMKIAATLIQDLTLELKDSLYRLGFLPKVEDSPELASYANVLRKLKKFEVSHPFADALAKTAQTMREIDDFLEKQNKELNGLLTKLNVLNMESQSIKDAHPNGEEIKSLAVSSDGRMIASGSNKGDIKIWRSYTKLLYHHFPGGHRGDVISLAFSPTGSHLLSLAEEKSFKIWSIQKKMLVRTVQSAHKKNLRTLCFSPNEKFIATGGHDMAIKLWSATSNLEKPVYTLERACTVAPVFSLVFFSDSKHLISSAADRKLRIWDVYKGHLVVSVDGGSIILSNAILPEKKLVASGCVDNYLRIYNAKTRKPVKKVLDMEENKPISSVAVLADENMIATCSGGTRCIHIRNTLTSEMAFHIKNVRNPINTSRLVSSEDGRFLVSQMKSNSILIFDLLRYKAD